jgi:hypothetical protein
MSDANLQTMYMSGRHTEMPADAEMRVPIPVLSHPNQTTPPYAAENPEKNVRCANVKKMSLYPVPNSARIQ